MNTLSSLLPATQRSTILEQVRRQPALRVPLDDALDAVLAEDIISPIDIPAWDNSAMDGYAVRAVDTREAGPDLPGDDSGWSNRFPPASFPPTRSSRAPAPGSSPGRRFPAAPTR